MSCKTEAHVPGWVGKRIMSAAKNKRIMLPMVTFGGVVAGGTKNESMKHKHTL